MVVNLVTNLSFVVLTKVFIKTTKTEITKRTMDTIHGIDTECKHVIYAQLQYILDFDC